MRRIIRVTLHHTHTHTHTHTHILSPHSHTHTHTHSHSHILSPHTYTHTHTLYVQTLQWMKRPESVFSGYYRE